MSLPSILAQETSDLQWRVLLARAVLAPLPPYVGVRLRTALLRMAGFRIGPGTVFSGMPSLFGPPGVHRRLSIGRDGYFNLGCVLELGAPITIGDRVAIAQEVMLLTTTHAIGSGERRAGPVESRPVRVGSGVWLGARAVVLPGVTIGDGAIVAAGAVVNRDVAPNSLVGGVPARPIRGLA